MTLDFTTAMRISHKATQRAIKAVARGDNRLAASMFMLAARMSASAVSIH